MIVFCSNIYKMWSIEIIFRYYQSVWSNFVEIHKQLWLMYKIIGHLLLIHIHATLHLIFSGNGLRLRTARGQHVSYPQQSLLCM